MFGRVLGTEDTAMGRPRYGSCLTLKIMDTNFSKFSSFAQLGNEILM